MAGARHGNPPAGVALPLCAGYVGNAVEDPAGGGPLTRCGHAGGTHRVRVHIAAGGVDHRFGEQVLLCTIRLCVLDQEGGLLAPGGLHFVKPLPGDGRHPGAQPNVGRQPVGEGLEIAVDQVAAGRVGLGVGELPAGPFQQRSGGLVHVVLPRGEHADMRPLAHVGGDPGPRLQHQRREASAQQMGSSRQSNGAGTDHNHRESHETRSFQSVRCHDITSSFFGSS